MYRPVMYHLSKFTLHTSFGARNLVWCCGACIGTTGLLFSRYPCCGACIGTCLLLVGTRVVVLVL